jgi:hypothetical protein
MTSHGTTDTKNDMRQVMQLKEEEFLILSK